MNIHYPGTHPVSHLLNASVSNASIPYPLPVPSHCQQTASADIRIIDPPQYFKTSIVI